MKDGVNGGFEGPRIRGINDATADPSPERAGGMKAIGDWRLRIADWGLRIGDLGGGLTAKAAEGASVVEEEKARSLVGRRI